MREVVIYGLSDDAEIEERGRIFWDGQRLRARGGYASSLMESSFWDGQQRREIFSKDDPERWLDLLLEKFQGTYGWAKEEHPERQARPRTDRVRYIGSEDAPTPRPEEVRTPPPAASRVEFTEGSGKRTPTPVLPQTGHTPRSLEPPSPPTWSELALPTQIPIDALRQVPMIESAEVGNNPLYTAEVEGQRYYLKRPQHRNKDLRQGRR